MTISVEKNYGYTLNSNYLSLTRWRWPHPSVYHSPPKLLEPLASNERMHQGFLGCDPLRWIEGQALVQKVDERSQELPFVVLQLHRGRWHETLPEVPRGCCDMHLTNDVLSRDERTSAVRREYYNVQHP